jgi:Icc-related predicted phosphoesterase
MKIAAMADVHMRTDTTGAYREVLAEISDRADVLVLGGDLTDHGRVDEAHALVAELRSCRVPIVGVLGNHDHQDGHPHEVEAVLRDAMFVLGEEGTVVDGVGFAGVKGFAGGFGERMLASFGEAAMKTFVQQALDEVLALEHALEQLEAEKKVVVMHYSPIRATVLGEPEEIFPFLGSSRFEAPIDEFKVRAVFHGHAHYGSPQGTTIGGVPVYNVALPVLRKHNPERPYALVEVL